MAKFIIRRLLLMLLTMFVVSVAVFLITEAAPGNVARNVLGIHITPEQEESFLNQQGLDEPFYVRYINWLIGTDWRASRKIGLPVKKINTEDGFKEWWGVKEDGTLIRWEVEGEDLIAKVLQPDGSVEESLDNERWEIKEPSGEVERLSAYREEIQENEQLREEDRQAILDQLDRILSILKQDQTKDKMLAALQDPESKLEALIDQNVLQKKSVFTKVANDIYRNNSLIQIFSIHQQLASDVQLENGDAQKMIRQLNKAAETVQPVNPSLANKLESAATALEEEDFETAQNQLESAVQAIDQLVGSLGTFVRALQAEDYQQANIVLENLADPSKSPLDAARLAVLPGVLEAIGTGFGDDLPDLSADLLQSVEALRTGNTEEARESLAEAANRFEEVASTIIRSESARGARVARSFWGVDTQNHAVLWEKGTGKVVWQLVMGSDWMATTGGPVDYIPLQKGLLRGDPGLSLRTGRPVADLLFTRLRNSLVLAGIAFVIVMPLALVLGLIAGLNEGKFLDRALSIGGMMFSVTPEFATGIFLILIFAFWLKLVPGATVFGEQAPWQRPEMLILPVLTLTLIELGYVLRITRASMSDVMKAPYIRTAFLKGLPYRRIVFKHAIRNALMAPITVIMLHVNWLLGGIVIVEVIFGYPGLGSYLLDSALFKDFNAIEGGAMILVAVAVSTQLFADIIYTFLNPRIRYD